VRVCAPAAARPPQDQMIRAFDTTSSRGLSFGEFERLHSFLLNVQASFKTFDV
jgi:hypothetical protein